MLSLPPALPSSFLWILILFTPILPPSPRKASTHLLLLVRPHPTLSSVRRPSARRPVRLLRPLRLRPLRLYPGMQPESETMKLHRVLPDGVIPEHLDGGEVVAALVIPALAARLGLC